MGVVNMDMLKVPLPNDGLAYLTKPQKVLMSEDRGSDLPSL